MAIGLDRSHDGRVTGVTARRSGQVLVIEAEAAPDADVSLELYAANDRRALLEDALGLAVEVIAG